MNAPALNIAAQRQPAAFRTLFSTEHRYDAGVAGLDFPALPGEPDHFAVHFDGRGSVPSVVLNGADGQVEVCGLRAMEALSDALLDALAMARRMSGEGL